jgi:hypothetical protein
VRGREAQWRPRRLEPGPLKEAARWVGGYRRFWEANFERLDDYLVEMKKKWKAYTSPEHLPHWLLGPPGWTMPVCEIDLHPGGAWHWVWRHSDGQEMEMRGVYKEIVPSDRVVSTCSGSRALF